MDMVSKGANLTFLPGFAFKRCLYVNQTITTSSHQKVFLRRKVELIFRHITKSTNPRFPKNIKSQYNRKSKWILKTKSCQIKRTWLPLFSRENFGKYCHNMENPNLDWFPAKYQRIWLPLFSRDFFNTRLNTRSTWKNPHLDWFPEKYQMFDFLHFREIFSANSCITIHGKLQIFLSLEKSRIHFEHLSSIRTTVESGLSSKVKNSTKFIYQQGKPNKSELKERLI